jgi:hypothetical protein
VGRDRGRKLGPRRAHRKGTSTGTEIRGGPRREHVGNEARRPPRFVENAKPNKQARPASAEDSRREYASDIGENTGAPPIFYQASGRVRRGPCADRWYTAYYARFGAVWLVDYNDRRLMPPATHPRLARRSNGRGGNHQSARTSRFSNAPLPLAQSTAPMSCYRIVLCFFAEMLAVPNRQELCETLVASNEGTRRPSPSTGVSFLVPATRRCLPSAWMASVEACPQHATSAAARASGKDPGRIREYSRGGNTLLMALRRGYLLPLRAPASFVCSATALASPLPSIHSITRSATGINMPAPSPSLLSDHEHPLLLVAPSCLIHHSFAHHACWRQRRSRKLAHVTSPHPILTPLGRNWP